jgi:hypothetical protein
MFQCQVRESGNEPLVCMKGGEFLDQFNDSGDSYVVVCYDQLLCRSFV